MLSHYRTRWLLATLTLAMAVATLCHAGGGFLNGGNAVGGVLIDAEGVVRLPARKDVDRRLATLRQALAANQDQNLAAPNAMRKISLKRLDETIRQHQSNGQPLPEDVLLLAGLQRIEYIFVYPEQQDIVIAGPAEGWRVNEQAEVVGVESGRPVMNLEDLLVAFRSAENARQNGIRCSIDPTPEGRQRFQAALRQIRVQGVRPAAAKAALEQAFGPQMVSLAGVPEDSHFARVLVAADYRMKRLAMNLEESPVAGLPSYPEMIRTLRRGADAQPRWWLACDYQPLKRSDDGLAWKIEGGVKAMTQDELIGADGSVRDAGKVNTRAQRWADLLTERYDELSTHIPAFGDLQNVMDMTVVAATIEGRQLRQLAGCSLPTLFRADSDYKLRSYPAPKKMAPQCSFLKTAGGTLITASGGVDLNAWSVASKTELSPVSLKRTPRGDSTQWWWN